ncbi:MAG: recombinase, partial [Pseudomonadota bacterium]
MFERAMLFLANPQKARGNGSFADKRTVLKLAFLDNLAFTRGKDFQAPKTSIPFKVLEDISNAKSNMV